MSFNSYFVNKHQYSPPSNAIGVFFVYKKQSKQWILESLYKVVDLQRLILLTL